MGLIRKLRGWMYRHSRQAQTDRIVTAMYNCTIGIVTAIEAAALMSDPCNEHESKVRIARVLKDAQAEFSKLARANFERSNG